MKFFTFFGVLLIILGVVALAYQGITYTTHKKVIDIGPIQGSVQEKKIIPLPPILGAAGIVAGVASVLVGVKKK